MIIGIGTDIIEIERIHSMLTLPKSALLRLFSEQELTYCLSIKTLSAQRLATRFAAREAFFKALTPLCKKRIPFFTVSRAITISKNHLGNPELIINWTKLNPYLAHQNNIINALVSLSHSRTQALALVILEQGEPIDLQDYSLPPAL